MANNTGKDLISERLNAMNTDKEKLKQEKPNVMQTIATGEVEEKPDFEKMAEALEKQKEELASANKGYHKDTLYIREDLFQAMQALCAKQGEKKKHVNAAYELYLSKIYREMQNNLNIDK